MSNTFSPSSASSRHLSGAAPKAAAAAAPSLGAAEMEMEVDQASLSRTMDCMASVQQIIRSGTSAHALAAQSEEDFEAQTDALLAAADIGIRPEDLNAADGGGHGADDLAALLGQLRTEPGSDEERA